LNGDLIQVKYADGEIVGLSVEVQERIYRNIQEGQIIAIKRKPSDKINKTTGLYYLLGFLAKSNAKFIAFIPEHALTSFKNIWYDAKGKELEDAQAGVIIHPPNTDKRWYECRITFKAAPQQIKQLESRNPQYSIVKANDSDEWNINNNKLFFSLIEYGFQVGADQIIDNIQRIIPEAYIESFNNGVNSALNNNL
jgi:hypothetical protein